MPNGKYFVFHSQRQIWAKREGGDFLRKVSYSPVQLTSGAISYSAPLPSKDGKKLYAVEGISRGELERYDSKTKTFAPFLGGISAQSVSFSTDGKWVAYVSFPEGTLWRSKMDGSDKLQLSFSPLYAMGPLWSPAGKEIVFWALQRGKPSEIYLVSADGGTPRQLMPNYSSPAADVTSSPDGDSLAFGGLANGPSAIRIFNRKTQKITMLPGPQGLFSPRWSPDGRYIAALSVGPQGLKLFDFQTRNWTTLTTETAGYPSWSANSEYIKFIRIGSSPGVFRVRIRDRKIEQLVSLKDFHMTGYYGWWFGLAPDNSPLLLKDTGSQDIVSMDWNAP
jgi:Tol biopolymer transport system component